MRLIVIVALTAVLIIATMDVLEVVQVALGAWLAMDIVTHVRYALDAMVLLFHAVLVVMKILVVAAV